MMMTIRIVALPRGGYLITDEGCHGDAPYQIEYTNLFACSRLEDAYDWLSKNFGHDEEAE